MSHGGGGEGKAAEPNLVPLLDMVMQLLMFFMISVNFVSEQVNESIQLPVAQSARPMDKNDTDVMFLNLAPFYKDAGGNRIEKANLQVVGKSPMDKKTDMIAYLKLQYSDQSEISKGRGGNGDVKTTVVIRADKDVDYEDVFQLMQLCKEAGFRKLQLRAMIKS